jgi:hypothetical protein
VENLGRATDQRAARWCRLEALRIAVASTIVVGFLAACSSDAGDDRSKESPTESSPTPSPSSASEDIVGVPVTKAKQPSGFPGDDKEFLRRVDGYLLKSGVTTEMNDRTRVAYGRQFCAILSGGGMVAGKVDFWGGTIQIERGPDAAIFVAALDIYCPELAAGYTRIRRGSQTKRPTVAQSADLARFVMTLHHPNVVPAAEALSTRILQRTASEYCKETADLDWPSTPEVVRTANRLPRPGRLLLLVGLTLGFCPETGEQLEIVLGTPQTTS